MAIDHLDGCECDCCSKQVELPMTDSEFWNACNNFDWFYDFSDDHRVWQKGNRAKGLLVREIKQSPVRREIYDGFYKHAFSGPHFGTEKSEKPVQP